MVLGQKNHYHMGRTSQGCLRSMAMCAIISAAKTAEHPNNVNWKRQITSIKLPDRIMSNASITQFGQSTCLPSRMLRVRVSFDAPKGLETVMQINVLACCCKNRSWKKIMRL